VDKYEWPVFHMTCGLTDVPVAAYKRTLAIKLLKSGQLPPDFMKRQQTPDKKCKTTSRDCDPGWLLHPTG
jgi:hypothetical protein